MKVLKNREAILSGNINKVLLTLSLPIMLGNVIQTIYQVTDMYWVSRLADGDNALGAISFIWPVIFVMLSFGIGINIAGTSMISQYVGMNKQNEARSVAGQLISFSLLFSLVLGIIGALYSKDILYLIGARNEILEYGSLYLGITFSTMPVMFLFFAYQSIRQGQGDTMTPMILLGSSVVLNIILDPILMFTLNMGVAGAAWATVISRALSTVVGVYLLFFSSNGIKLRLSDLSLNLPVLKDIVRIGMPSALGQSIDGLGFMVMNIFVLSFGAYTMTAFAIGNKINSLILMPAMGIGGALATVIGQNVGAGQTERASKAVYASMKLSVLILSLGGAVIILFAPQVVGIFTDDPVVSAQAIFYLRLITAAIPLMGIFQSLVGCFQGAGHTMTVMFVTTSRLWAMRIPLIILLKHFTPLAEHSIWYSMVISNLLTCILAYVIFLRGSWKKKTVKEQTDPEPEPVLA